MLASEIISGFELYVDDTTELSSTQELVLLNKIYRKVCDDRPWEFLKKSVSGTLSTTLPYITLPSDFSYLAMNNDTADNADEANDGNNGVAKVVFVGTAYTPNQLVNWSNRRKYLNKSGYCYIDIVNGRLYFTSQPTIADTYEFDYLSNPTDLTLSASPVFPVRFHEMLYHGMAVEDEITQKYPKAQSYAPENKVRFDEDFARMCSWNARLALNN